MRARARPRPGQRRQVPPDDRLTTILPPVIDDRSPRRRATPIDEVKAALDGPAVDVPVPAAMTRSTRSRPRWTRRDAATVCRRARDRPVSGRPPAGRTAAPPPAARRRGRTGQEPPGPTEAALDPAGQLAVGATRGSISAAAMLVLLPIVTFAMAYFIVDIPKPGDIRTNQVSTILASDGSEIAKIVPPEGNRVDVNLNQVPVHVRQAVIAAEDRNFYSNPGFSFTRLRAGGEQQPLRRRRPAGRVDDHPAVREERAGRFRATRVRAA